MRSATQTSVPVCSGVLPRGGRRAGGSEAAAPDGAAAPAFVVTTSRPFPSWQADTGGSLTLSTYQSGKVIQVGANRQAGRLSIFERTLERPMGMAFRDSRLVVASMIQITSFVDAARGTPGAAGYDALFVPQSASYTADLDVHDIAFDADGRLVFVNTLFSGLATTSETHSFKPLWRPPFVSRLAPEDRHSSAGVHRLQNANVSPGESAFASQFARPRRDRGHIYPSRIAGTPDLGDGLLASLLQTRLA